MSFGGGGGGTSTTTNKVEPYAPATPALNQIISEAGTIYGQGPAGTGYVPPSQQTLQGLAAQEQIAGAANQQIMDTIQGKFTNPFLSPLIAQAGQDIYTNVAGQFSGAGRTPTSPMAQQQALAQVAQAALPLAFQEYGIERGRQLGVAQRIPSLLQTGQQLEAIQRQQQLAPFQALQQYAGLVSPIASGFPVQTGSVATQASPVTTALGGALIGSRFGGQGAILGGLGGLLGGLL